jgi:hypothetical protein
MKGKNEEGDEVVARITGLSRLGATLVVDEALATYANLKLKLVDAGAVVEGDLYAKVTAGGATCALRFTAVPPPVEKFVASALAGSASSPRY